MRNRRHMYRFFTILAFVFLNTGCGARPAVEKISSSPESAQIEAQYAAGVKAFEAGRTQEAKRQFEAALKLNPRGLEEQKVRFYLARINIDTDAGKASDTLLLLAQQVEDPKLKRQAQLYGGLAAGQAHRCMTVQKIIVPLLEQLDASEKGHGALAVAQCLSEQESLKFLAIALETLPDSEEAKTKAKTASAGLSQDDLTEAARTYAQTPLGVFLFRRIARGARETGDRKALESALEYLDADEAEAKAAHRFLARPVLGLIVPRTGRAGALGKRLEANLTALLAQQSEDRPETAFELTPLDGSNADAAVAAIEDLASKAFGAVGIFDDETAAAAIEAADRLNFPLVCMSHSNAPLQSKNGWRAIHTPLLVARTAAGAGLHSGGKRALIVHAGEQYGAHHAHWFRLSWQAGGGQIVDELTWSRDSVDWVALAKTIERQDFDTVFLPSLPEDGVQLLRHLAAIDIWVENKNTVPGPNSGGRRIKVIVTPEWYRPRLARLAGRYAAGVLLPVPFARETMAGAKFEKMIQAAGGRSASSFDAIGWDALRSLAVAHAHGRRQNLSASAAVQGSTLKQGAVTPGLRFDSRDALPALFVLRATRSGFEPALQ